MNDNEPEYGSIESIEASMDSLQEILSQISRVLDFSKPLSKEDMADMRRFIAERKARLESRHSPR